MTDPQSESVPSSPPTRGFLAATVGAFLTRFGSMMVVGGLFSLPAALWVWHTGGGVAPTWYLRLALNGLHLVGIAVITGLVLHDLAGDRCSLARMAGRAVRRMPAMMVASFIPTLMFLGLFWLGVHAARHAGPLAPLVLITTFIIVIGLSSALRLSVTAAFVEPRSGTASMARSLALTRGRRLRIFLAQLALGILISPLMHVLSRFEPGTAKCFVAQLFVNGAVMGLTASFAAVVYAELRRRRDGDEPAAIAADLMD